MIKALLVFTLLLPLCATSAESKKTDKNEEPTSSTQELSWSEGWAAHYKGVFNKAFDKTGRNILLTGTAITLSLLPWDEDIHENIVDKGKGRLSSDITSFGSKWGAGVYTGAIALGQLIFDYENGIHHWEAFIYTSLTSGLIKNIISRERPNKTSDTSFPSGHTATATVAAASLWHAYGWQVGLPLSGLAVLAGLSRLADSAHYASDVVFGATLAIFWTRAVAPNSETQLTPYFDLSRGIIGWHYQY